MNQAYSFKRDFIIIMMTDLGIVKSRKEFIERFSELYRTLYSRNFGKVTINDLIEAEKQTSSNKLCVA